MPVRKQVAVAFAWIATASLILSGCGNMLTNSSEELDDESTIREIVDEGDWFAESGVYDGQAFELGLLGERGEINPINFWRAITERYRKIETTVNHQTLTKDVEITEEYFGKLFIVDDEMNLYEKPMHHTGLRYATFARVTEDALGTHGGAHRRPWLHDHRHRRGPWLLTAISGIVVRSEELTVEIDWMQMEGASVDAIVTDPLELLDVPEEIMSFNVGDDITVTVSGPDEDALLFLHTPGAKQPLGHQSDGTFSGTWTVDRQGLHCVWIEAIEHDSIFDSEYPDDVLIWGMPYVAEGDGHTD